MAQVAAAFRDRQPRVELVVLQPTPFCNIACRYCYLPNRDDRSVMPHETIAAAFDKLFASGWVDRAITAVWHAGEPLVLPPGYYRDAFQLIADRTPDGVQVRHAVQTNGMLINDDWCDLFLEWDVEVGVSIDGPKRLHDQARLTRAGRGSFDRAIEGARTLRRRSVPFHLISVLTQSSLAAPDEMFDFYAAEGITEVCFNVEESEGSYDSPTLAQPGSDGAYLAFLRRFWRRWTEAPHTFSFVREIEHAVEQVVRPSGTVVSNQLTEPFAIVSIDWRGRVSTFSPELLGQKDPRYDDFIIGHIHTDTFAQMRDSPALARMQADIEAGVRMCRDTCGYYSVCGGGEPVNKLAENGSFASAETRYCRATKQRVTDLVLEAIESLSCPEAAAAPELRRVG